MGQLVPIWMSQPETSMAKHGETDDVSGSLSQDIRQRAKTRAKRGEGDRGDRKSR
jgi:hypothetical protein